MTGAAFAYVRPGDVDGALVAGGRPSAMYLAGGTDLMQLWRIARAEPQQVVDITRLPLAGIVERDGVLSIGATARLQDVAAHPLVVAGHPLIAAAIQASASGQVRNMATVGGNLLQRTRCPYFRTEDVACNKHSVGSGCPTIGGEHRHAALFGASDHCLATHPSDLAVALRALDASVDITGANGARRIGLDELYRLPGDRPNRDTNLGDGEMITAINVRDGRRFAGRCAYLKVRDRASFEFMVVSVAVALRIDAGVVAEASVVVGGVAPMPWRLPACERLLVGRPADAAAFAAAARSSGDGARPLTDNRFKVELVERAIIRALGTSVGTG